MHEHHHGRVDAEHCAHHHEHGHEHYHHHDHEHPHTPLEELADLAHQLAHAGSKVAYDKVMTAVAKFDEGNAILAAVLQELSAE